MKVMLQLSRNLIRKPVLSLRTGTVVAQALAPVINPDNLKIEGFYCDDVVNRQSAILLTQDIREILKQGYIVNDEEVLTQPEELVRLQKILAMGFQLEGKLVVTTEKERLGKINDYATDSTTFYIQKLYVTPTLLKSLSSGQLGIDRNQIVEITPKKVIVKPPLQLSKAPSALGAPAS